MTSRIDAPDTPADLELRELLDKQQARGFIVRAGAGSGKTTTLVKALDHIITAHGEELRPRGQRVACITYTNVAAAEIHGDVGQSPLARVSTIHSFLWSLTESFQQDIGKWLRNKNEEPLPDDLERYTYGPRPDHENGVLGHTDVIKMATEFIQSGSLLARMAAGAYPYIFVDESQDTFPEVVTLLKRVSEVGGTRCLGFFGDPMQQILMGGIGEIESKPDWVAIDKPENFRSSGRVLSVINRIRADGDSLKQASGKKPEDRLAGEVFFFILLSDDRRTERLEEVRSWLSRNSSAGSWGDGDASQGEGAKVLMIMHRMIARRLGFGNMFDAFDRSGKESLRAGFREGTAWPLLPFLNVILPLCGTADGDSPTAISIVRETGVLNSVLRGKAPRKGLDRVRAAIDSICAAVARGGPGSVRSVLDLAVQARLVSPEPRLAEYLAPDDKRPDPLLSDKEKSALDKFFDCDISELLAYQKYIADQSPYSTQQGTKGAEFRKVIVVLDDEEGKDHKNYSYEKLLGLKKLSPTDTKRIKAGEDSTPDRTRRLLYVCASRAMESLAIVLITNDVSVAETAIRESGIASDGRIVTELD